MNIEQIHTNGINNNMQPRYAAACYKLNLVCLGCIHSSINHLGGTRNKPAFVA